MAAATSRVDEGDDVLFDLGCWIDLSID